MRFKIPHAIVTNNDNQFDNRNYRDMCSGLGIKGFLISIPPTSEWTGRSNQ